MVKTPLLKDRKEALDSQELYFSDPMRVLALSRQISNTSSGEYSMKNSESKEVFNKHKTKEQVQEQSSSRTIT